MGRRFYILPRVPDAEGTNIMNSEKANVIYVTKEHADAHYVKANCTLLAVRGEYYYTEKFGKFIKIGEWEYERILAWPYHVYFTTALKKHFEWRAANRKGTTLTFSEVLSSKPRREPKSKYVPENVSPSQRSGANTKRLAITKLLRHIADYPIRVYGRCVLWLRATVHRWQDVKTVAQAVEPHPSRAQEAWLSLDRRIEQWMEASRSLRLIGAFLNWGQKLRARPEVHSVGAAAFGVAVIAAWWCGGPVRFALSAIPHSIAFGVGLLFAALTAANLMVAVVLVIVFALVLPVHVWRVVEVISGFVLRHVLPHGVAWRYRGWHLRRTGRWLLRHHSVAKSFSG
jgi:hypothetical protein